MHPLVLTILKECIQLAFSLVLLFLTRWLFLLSTPEEDLIWLKPLYNLYKWTQWYTGPEFAYQLRARKLATEWGL